MALNPPQPIPPVTAGQNDPYEEFYQPITGNADAEKMRQIDPIGSAVFGWGNNAWNRQINNTINDIGQERAQLNQEDLANIEKTTAANQQAWQGAGTDIFGPNGQALDDFYSGVEGKDQSALGDLLQGLGNYKDSANLFNDPSFFGDVGDVRNELSIDPTTMAAQKSALGQYAALTTPQETGAEQLMRLQAERQQEQNEAGDRAAEAASLKARGVYGSGDELVSALMSQSNNAQMRSMANAQANAQAQQRAMSALGSYSDLANTLHGQQDTEGQIANQVNEFNNTVNQNTANQRAQSQIAATQAGQNAFQSRAQAGFNASQDVNNQARQDTQNRTQADLTYTQGETGDNTNSANLLSTGLNNTNQDLASRQAQLAAQKRSSLLGSIF